MLGEGGVEAGLFKFFFKQSGSYGVYQAILCNNCKYSLNIFESINNIFVIANMYLRFFSFYFFFLFMVEKSYASNQLALLRNFLE